VAVSLLLVEVDGGFWESKRLRQGMRALRKRDGTKRVRMDIREERTKCAKKWEAVEGRKWLLRCNFEGKAYWKVCASGRALG